MLAVVAATIVVMLIVIKFATHHERKVRARRAGVLQSLADNSGFEYEQTCDDAFRESVLTLPGVTKKSTTMNRVSGTLADRSFTAFETYYITRNPEAMVPVHHTVFTLDAPDYWRTLKVSPRCWWGRLMYRLGRRRGMVFESEEFTSTFRVEADDEAFAIAFLSPELQAFMLEKTDVVWHVEPGRLSLVYSGSLKTDRINASLARLERGWSLIDDALKM